MKSLHLEYFKNIVGDDNIYIDKAHLLAYSYDATKNQSPQVY